MLVISRVLFLSNVLAVLCLIGVAGQVEELTGDEDDLSSNLEWDEVELDDACDKLANAELSYYKNRNADTLNEKISSILHLWQEQDDRMSKYKEQSTARTPTLRRKLELLLHPGNEALSEEKRTAIAELMRKADELVQNTSVPCFNNTQENCTMNLTEAERRLKQCRDPEELEYLWTQVQSKASALGEEFSNILLLATEAAVSNGAEDVEKYWLMLTEYPSTYDDVRQLWDAIKPLYSKLHKYVFEHLKLRYGAEAMRNSTLIPIHLLNSVTGSDWSGLSDLLLQEENNSTVYSSLLKNLKQKGFGGRMLYKKAEKFLEDCAFGNLLDSFWDTSVFDGTCPARVVHYCDADGTTSVVTCEESDWEQYVESHSVVADAISHRFSSKSGYLFKNAPRMPVIYDAAKGSFSLLASSPSYLKSIGLIDDDGNDKVDATVSLLTALRVLPKLPYYLATDLWRLEVIRNNITSPENMTQSWKNYRETFQLVSEPEGDILHFLESPEVLENKPYLGKFTSIILQFQIIEHLLNKTGNTSDILATVKGDGLLRELLSAGFSEKWPDLLRNHSHIQILGAESLLRYFEPLEEYLDNYNFESGDLKTADQRAGIGVLGNSTETTGEEEVNQSGFGSAVLFACVAAAAVGIVGMFFLVGRQKFKNRRQYERTKSEPI